MKKQTIDADILNQAIQLRHELHMHPELSMHEEWTKNHLISYLREHTNLQIVDKDKWFYAVYHTDASKCSVAFRADFDAVPVEEAGDFVLYSSHNKSVAHKCGHDGHSAAMVAFALMLDRYGADCNTYLLFQHAEETGQGALECLPFLEENKIDEIYAVHNMPGLKRGAVAVSEGVVQYASTGVILRFEGKHSHACYPEDGINPAYAISELVIALNELQKARIYKGLTLITIIGIKVGERAFGTSAGEGELLLTIRGEFGDELKDLKNRIEQLAENKAKTHDLQLQVKYEDEFEECFNHASAVQTVRDAAKYIGADIQPLKEPFRASEDFGRFTKLVSGAIFYVGAGESHPALHTASYDFPDEIIENIASIYGAIVQMIEDNTER